MFTNLYRKDLLLNPEELTDDLNCQWCNNILYEPSKCGFCTRCICKECMSTVKTDKCQYCKKTFKPASLEEVMRELNELIFACESCGSTHLYADLPDCYLNSCAKCTNPNLKDDIQVKPLLKESFKYIQSIDTQFKNISSHTSVADLEKTMNTIRVKAEEQKAAVTENRQVTKNFRDNKEFCQVTSLSEMEDVDLSWINKKKLKDAIYKNKFSGIYLILQIILTCFVMYKIVNIGVDGFQDWFFHMLHNQEEFFAFSLGKRTKTILRFAFFVFRVVLQIVLSQTITTIKSSNWLSMVLNFLTFIQFTLSLKNPILIMQKNSIFTIILSIMLLDVVSKKNIAKLEDEEGKGNTSAYKFIHFDIMLLMIMVIFAYYSVFTKVFQPIMIVINQLFQIQFYNYDIYVMSRIIIESIIYLNILAQFLVGFFFDIIESENTITKYVQKYLSQIALMIGIIISININKKKKQTQILNCANTKSLTEKVSQQKLMKVYSNLMKIFEVDKKFINILQIQNYEERSDISNIGTFSTLSSPNKSKFSTGIKSNQYNSSSNGLLDVKMNLQSMQSNDKSQTPRSEKSNSKSKTPSEGKKDKKSKNEQDTIKSFIENLKNIEDNSTLILFLNSIVFDKREFDQIIDAILDKNCKCIFITDQSEVFEPNFQKYDFKQSKWIDESNIKIAKNEVEDGFILIFQDVFSSILDNVEPENIINNLNMNKWGSFLKTQQENFGSNHSIYCTDRINPKVTFQQLTKE